MACSLGSGGLGCSPQDPSPLSLSFPISERIYQILAGTAHQGVGVMNAGAETTVWGDVGSKGRPLFERHSVGGGKLGDPQIPNSRPEQREKTAPALDLPDLVSPASHLPSLGLRGWPNAPIVGGFSFQ